MDQKELFDLAIKCGVADYGLSGDDQLMSDYGDCTEAVRKFAAAVAEKCATIADDHEARESNPASVIAEKIRERFGLRDARSVTPDNSGPLKYGDTVTDPFRLDR